MFKMPNFKLKPFIIIFFIVVIAVSFLFLKIQQKYQARNFVDSNPSGDNSPEVASLSPKYSSKIKKFADVADFSSFIEKNQVNFENNYLKRSDMAMDIAFASTESLDSSLANNEMVGGTDFSLTNVQVQGVDEADIVKTDGSYIYYVSEKTLYIVEAYPVENNKILSKLEFDSYLSDIYIKGDSLVVFGNEGFNYGMPKDRLAMSIGIMPPMSNSVFLQVFNISDKTNPIKEKDLKMDGSYFDSRLIGDYLYFLVNNYNYYGQGLPRVSYQDKELNFNCQDGLKCAPSNIYYFDNYYDNFNLTSVTSLNITDFNKEPESNFYLLPAGQNLYVSQNNIYITYTKYLNEYEVETDALLEIIYPRLSENDRKIVDEINSASENILTLSEKRSKVRRILDLYINFLSLAEREALQKDLDNKIMEKYPNILEELEKTVIHKLAVFEGAVEPIFMGEVSGSVLNQFSMDEFDGFFRMATTKNRSWSRFASLETDSYNNVYVLDSNLELTGEIKGLAEGERIYSVRFMGDKAYVVTFKQVDPLFSVDLRDPYNPKVLGELKIPGFSNYLHPYDNNTLIGFGKETQEESDGRVITGGLKLSLFDVSSDEPKELDSYVIGDLGSDSIALYDHRAFLFSKDKNLLAVPVVLRESAGDNSWGDISFNGLLVFNIIDNKFVLKGQIDHLLSEGTNEAYNYEDSVKRGLYIKEYFYSLSDNFIKINEIKDLKEALSIKLK
ncbi:hypothetical protein CVU82_00680 [Candidatus Falkowbacteria bacterium HGW-Falkowbacteria-1]|uniref:Copper amine oxidase-like N-terminal domain-containing protein n=1 Tax=Candidatus Falkowbacteria bacterium HGW-Falkowbacteria-1 TaxID=2013768 RepID=A0A2N2EAI9_9BACT|nr:MAG: hypothetical protein CVU82_00680 [Candidatus Falkowbacteria bacterium HGW-Falkowbacteria-1]